MKIPKIAKLTVGRWFTKDGRDLTLADMDVAHLENVWMFLEKKLRFESELDPGYQYEEDAQSHRFQKMHDRAIVRIRTKMTEIEDELARRRS